MWGSEWGELRNGCVVRDEGEGEDRRKGGNGDWGKATKEREPEATPVRTQMTSDGSSRCFTWCSSA